MNEILKRDMENAARDVVREYNESDQAKVQFLEPAIGYVNTRDPRYDKLFDMGITKHPKVLYRPAYNAMVYFLPFAEDKTGDYDAYYEAMKLSMTINRRIRDALDRWGRLSAICSSMADWNKKRWHYDWDPKYSGVLAGLGNIGPAGSFYDEAGHTGRVGVVLFDQKFAADVDPDSMSEEELQTMYEDMMTACCYDVAKNVTCSEEMIAACPGKAISEKGIDRELCQEHCMTINAALPDPELCGKCFKFHK